VIDADTELIYSEEKANSLNASGITTINYIGGSFRLWGGHMSNYDYSKIDTIEAKDRSDATIRMQIYLDNWLKAEHIDNIDSPLTRRDIDNIISDVNIGLNSFVNNGYLLKGECYFDDSNNPTGELADGNLVLDILHTEVPNGKSISFRLQYDTSGLETLYSATEV
jgi:phage tail sheath protein FI